MREILFRGKRVDTGEWLYGYFGIDDNKPLIAINKENGINGYFVYPDTVGQYTGLKDKNGKKIFEGDIIRINNSEDVFLVEFDFESEASYICTNKKKYPYFYHRMTYKNTEYEVIGSVHDNPELLEAK